jgi:lysophospholipase L1-like esterase
MRWVGLALASMLFAAWAEPPMPAAPGAHWVASWGAAQMVADPMLGIPDDRLRDASVRQVVRVSIGGARLRVRISNVFGTSPLVLNAASVARAVKPGSSGIVPGTLRDLLFAGQSRIAIPAGSEIYSDPVVLEHAARSDIAVSLYFTNPPSPQTSHPGSSATSFRVAGNRVSSANWPDASKFVGWLQLSGLEVEAPGSVGAVVAIGDSTTEGNVPGADRNERWTDFLVRRLERERRAPMGVVNAGIGGNVLTYFGIGPDLRARFERDVLARSGVTHAIVLIGVNDLGGQHRNGEDTPLARAQLLADMQLAFRQIVGQAHARGICVIGATILPFGSSDYYRPGPENEADREALNDWIRSSNVFDAVADFDAATRRFWTRRRLREEYDAGDGLHLSPAGFRAMAEAVPLDALRLSCNQGAGVSR